MIYPPVTIVMTTWFRDQQRKKVAENTLISWFVSLKYAGELRLHVADDGSNIDWEPENLWYGRSVTRSRQMRRGVGASLNKGIMWAFESASPVVLYAVDDWRLLQPFDLTPWVRVLLEDEHVGIVRLGPPHPSLTGAVKIYTEDWQGWGLKLDPVGHCIGHRPELFHRRMIEYYGWFKENCNACECEADYNQKWLADPALEIVLALPHPWLHLDPSQVSSLSEIEPA